MALCLLCAALSAPGQSYTLALYIEPIAADLGRTQVELTSAYAWATFAAALLLPFVGRLADRVASRWFLGGVLMLLGLVMAALARANTIAMVVPAFFALRLLGQGAVGLGVLTAVARRFDRRRSRAIAIAVSGYALGEFAVPGIIVALQAEYGWRGSLGVLAAAYVVAFSPLLFGCVKSPPPISARHEGPGLQTPEPGSFSISVALRTPRFWALVLFASTTPFVLTGLFINHVALFATLGWTPLDVARALQVYALASLTMTYLMGWLLDWLVPKLGITTALSFLTAALLLPTATRNDAWGVAVYGGFLGAAAGAMNATQAVIWPKYFGVASLGTIKGVVNMIRNGVTAAAAPLGAWLLIHHDFPRAGMLVAGLCGIAAVLALLLPGPPHTEGS